MKIFILFVLLFLTADAQNFFPVYTCNNYQVYTVVDFWGGPGGYSYHSEYWQKFGVAETLTVGSSLFYRFNRKIMTSNLLFYHYDENQQKLFVKIPGNDTVRLAADFNAPANNSYISYFNGSPEIVTSQGISSSIVFGDTLLSYKMIRYSGPYDWLKTTFTENIGITYSEYAYRYIDEVDLTTNTLKSAIVDTIFYNPITLNINSISPLVNRPANTFPFMLSGNYSSTYPSLIDTFFVEIIHLHNDGSADTLSRPFISGSASINFLPEAGDTLLLRAFISDNSIFENEDFYPDSGYARIAVLPALTDIKDHDLNLTYSLSENFPNPFNPFTTINYSVPERVYVTIKIFDVLGKEITTVVNSEVSAGSYSVNFNGSFLPGGVYFCRMETPVFNSTKKMILLK